MTMTLETVTPTKAETWLAANKRNRHVNKAWVEDIAAALRRGEYKPLAPIAFDWNGVLIDGQHRLLAIIESGVTIKLWVAHNVDPDTQQVIDTGRKRRLADELHMQGIPNAALLAAMVVLVYRAEQHTLRTTSAHPTIPEGLALLSRHPNLPMSIPAARGVSARLGGPPSIYGFLHYHFASIESDDAQEDADYFFEHLGTGEGLEPGDPLLALRRLLERARQDPSNTLTQATRMAVFIKAWNAFRSGEPIQKLYWKAGGANPEKWPVAR
jgi:hypothetical protein